jgi:hypothetical protein
MLGRDEILPKLPHTDTLASQLSELLAGPDGDDWASRSVWFRGFSTGRCSEVAAVRRSVSAATKVGAGRVWDWTVSLARSILGPYILTNDRLEIPGSTILGFPTRFRSLGLEGVPRVTIRGHNALDRDFPNIQALGCAQCGIPGRYFLRVLPLLIKMEFEVNDQLFHCWSKVFSLKRHSDDLTVGVERSDGRQYPYQSGQG